VGRGGVRHTENLVDDWHDTAALNQRPYMVPNPADDRCLLFSWPRTESRRSHGEPLHHHLPQAQHRFFCLTQAADDDQPAVISQTFQMPLEIVCSDNVQDPVDAAALGRAQLHD
jgi:hypothetical protein